MESVRRETRLLRMANLKVLGLALYFLFIRYSSVNAMGLKRSDLFSFGAGAGDKNISNMDDGVWSSEKNLRILALTHLNEQFEVCKIT